MKLLVVRVSSRSLPPPLRGALGVLDRTMELAPPAKGEDAGAAREAVRAEFPGG